MPNLWLIGALLIFFAASFRVAFFYYVLYFFLLVALLARLWIWRAWRKLEIQRDFDDHVFLDEAVTLRLRVSNAGRLPLPWVRVEDKLPNRLTWWSNSPSDASDDAAEVGGRGGAVRLGSAAQEASRGANGAPPAGQRPTTQRSGEGASAAGRAQGMLNRLAGRDSYRAVVSLLAGETRLLEYTVYASRRGYYPIGPLEIDLGDVFGFYTRSLRTAEPSYLTVYPKILPLEQLGLPSKSPFGSLRTHQIIYEDPSRVVGVRDYLRGDSLRNVNWKVSAALGRLQVKKFELAITLDTVIVLNLNLEEYDLSYADGATELAITVAASLANHLAELRQPIGLISNGRDVSVRPPGARAATPAGGNETGPSGSGAGDAETEDEDVPERPRGLSAPQPWEIDRRGMDELGFALPGSLPARTRPSIAVLPGKGRAHLMRVMEALARAQARNGYPLASLLRQQSVRLPWGSTIVVITWGRAMGLVEALVALRRAGYTVVIVLVRFGMRDTFPAEMAALGFQVHEVRSEQDATLFDQRRVAV